VLLVIARQTHYPCVAIPSEASEGLLLYGTSAKDLPTAQGASSGAPGRYETRGKAHIVGCVDKVCGQDVMATLAGTLAEQAVFWRSRQVKVRASSRLARSAPERTMGRRMPWGVLVSPHTCRGVDRWHANCLSVCAAGNADGVPHLLAWSPWEDGDTRGG